ncbi:hypothetical protein AG1IA_08417 [Rhizoctonia solani AG-1 IA]|uniref:Uncharacterized protein n=1 Tax=Thanatephorus cucumeris (strain AG1-IA) TaxID=983506 RepID=L8WL59_THACA|nr:hypothetical protein AG1IA_08417 [Rhizoctonia solani AG-1 IA]
MGGIFKLSVSSKDINLPNCPVKQKLPHKFVGKFGITDNELVNLKLKPPVDVKLPSGPDVKTTGQKREHDDDADSKPLDKWPCKNSSENPTEAFLSERFTSDIRHASSERWVRSA